MKFHEVLDDSDAYNASPVLPPKDGAAGAGGAQAAASGGKASKWQPLTSVEPSPIAENDPFSLGDSEDEKDHGKKTTSGDEGIKMEDAERLRQAAAEAMADSIVDEKAKTAGAEAKKE